VDETPVFVREGALIPEQGVSAYSDAKPVDTLVLNVYGSGQGSFELYEDDGVSLGYDKGEYAVTALRYATDNDGLHHLVIEPTRGVFQGQLPARTYELHIHAAGRPASISVDGKDLGPGTWDAAQATAIVVLPRRAIGDRIEVTWR
jgi:hypothetical protein